MKGQLLTLAKQTLVYGVSSAALQLVGIVTLPVFARSFSPSEYGVLEIATVGLSAMLVIADLGMASASQRSYFDYTDEDVEQRRSVLATALATALGAASLLAVLLILNREAIADAVLHDRDQADVVVLVALALPLSILASLQREVMRLRFMAWSYTFSATSAAVVAAALAIWLVVGTDSGIEGVLIGVVAGNAVATLYGLVVTFRFFGLHFSRRELKVMLAFGLPLVPAVAAMWGLAFFDRVMIGSLADLDELGQYAVGARFASVLMLAVTAFGLAYIPFMLSMFSEDPELEMQVRSRTLTYVAIVLTSLSLALALFAREVATIVAPGYTEAYQVVGVLCLGVTIFGLSSITMAGISFVRRTGYFGAYSGIALVVNVALNFVLIPLLGGFGAALATAIAYATLTSLSYRKAQALYPTPYEPRKTLIVLATCAALMPLGFLPLGIGYFALKLLALAAFAGMLALGRVFDREELAEMRALTGRLSPSR